MYARAPEEVSALHYHFYITLSSTLRMYMLCTITLANGQMDIATYNVEAAAEARRHFVLILCITAHIHHSKVLVVAMHEVPLNS